MSEEEETLTYNTGFPLFAEKTKHAEVYLLRCERIRTAIEYQEGKKNRSNHAILRPQFASDTHTAL